MVVLNRIYTRTGDDGTTALGSGERRPKYDLRISAYGTVDETNAAIGIVRLHLADAPELDAMLGLIQNDLFDLGADLAVPEREGKAERLRVLSTQVERLEHDIDALNAKLAPLTSFVLPGGTPAAAYLHLARTICRRAERIMVELAAKPDEPVSDAAIQYMSTACRTFCSSPAVRRTIMAPATCSGCPARTAENPSFASDTRRILRSRALARRLEDGRGTWIRARQEGAPRNDGVLLAFAR